MASSGASWARASVLIYDRREQDDSRLALLWPAWAYRVTAPVLRNRGLDLFERVVLGLCQAGVRQSDRIAALVELHPRLCAHILDRAVETGLLDDSHDLTDNGRQSLRTGSAQQAPEWQVCYVFEDPFTGELWPRTVESLREAYLVRANADGVELELGTAGRSDRARARRIIPPDDRHPQPPGAARVVAVASQDRAARRVGKVRDFERFSGLDAVVAPDEVARPRGPGNAPLYGPDLTRVSFLAEPEPVFLVGFLSVSGGADAETAEAWTAFDPFGLGPSEFFQSLVYRFGRDDGSLDSEIQVRAEAEIAVARATLRQAEDNLRVLLEQRLAHDFGPEIRGSHQALSLMLDLDLHDGPAPREEAVEAVAHLAYRLYEILLCRMGTAYPLSQRTFTTFKDAGPPLRRALLETAAQSIGFHGVTRLYTGVSDDELKRTYNDPRKGFVKAACALSILAATEHADHPLRQLAAEHPDIPMALDVLNELRNRVAHGARDAPNPDDTQWCRELAASAVRALLRLPEPRTERTSF